MRCRRWIEYHWWYKIQKEGVGEWIKVLTIPACLCCVEHKICLVSSRLTPSTRFTVCFYLCPISSDTVYSMKSRTLDWGKKFRVHHRIRHFISLGALHNGWRNLSRTRWDFLQARALDLHVQMLSHMHLRVILPQTHPIGHRRGIETNEVSGWVGRGCVWVAYGTGRILWTGQYHRDCVKNGLYDIVLDLQTTAKTRDVNL